MLSLIITLTLLHLLLKSIRKLVTPLIILLKPLSKFVDNALITVSNVLMVPLVKLAQHITSYQILVLAPSALILLIYLLLPNQLWLLNPTALAPVPQLYLALTLGFKV